MILSGLEIKKRIGNQIIIEPYDENYCSGKYQNNTGIQPSLPYKDFEKGD